MAFYEWQGSDLLLNVHVQTRAKMDCFDGLHGDRVKLRINALPTDNKANQHIINYLASEFRVRQSDIKLIGGQKHRDKQLIIKHAEYMPDWFNALSDNDAK